MSAGTILCVNAGSSSLKAALYTSDEDGGGGGLGLLGRANRAVTGEGYETALDGVLAGFAERGLLAPLHLPASIAGIEALETRCPGVPQVACFDTAFHRRMPEVAQRLPVSEDLRRIGVRRYGFHGLSYEHVVASLGGDLGERTIVAHLGSGSSMAAIRDGQSVDTTMAVEMFCTQAPKFVGALAAVLGGLDTLVFTGGIGERSAVVRAEICDGPSHLGVRLDPDRNQGAEPVVSADGAGCTVRAVVCDEELVIARHTRQLVGGMPGTAPG